MTKHSETPVVNDYKRNLRVPNNPRCHDADPFAELGISPDENIHQVAEMRVGNGLSRAECQQQSQLFTPNMSHIDRYSAARNFVHDESHADRAERFEDTMSKLPR